MSFFVTADGGLTMAGYVGCVEAGVLCDGDGAGVCDFVCEGV